MKESQTCPKCAHRRIWVIEPFRLPYENLEGSMQQNVVRAGHALPLVVHQNPDGVMTRPVGQLAAYVCAACGYSELYASDFEKLVPDPAKGIRLLDGAAQAPFR